MHISLESLAWAGAIAVAALTVFNFIRNIGRDANKDWNTKFDALFAAFSLHEARTSERLGKLSETLATIQVKVDTMWEFIMRRAKSELVAQGMGTMNSPLFFTPAAKAAIAPLEGELRRWYDNDPRLSTLSDTELAIELEREYGDEILTLVCIPHKLFMGACLWIAIEAARGDLALMPDEPDKTHTLVVETAHDRKELHDRMHNLELAHAKQVTALDGKQDKAVGGNSASKRTGT